MTEATLPSKPFQPASQDGVATELAQLLAATPLGIVLQALRAPAPQGKAR